MNNEYIKLLNEKQEEINKLRTSNSKLLIDNIRFEYQLKCILTYIEFLINEPTYKSVNEILSDIKEIITGEKNE